jgi:hypothetical protein
MRRQGDPRAERPVAHRNRTGDGYRAALAGVRGARGRAAGHRCADCTSRSAAVWSYDGTDRDPRIDGPSGRRFSLDPTHYRPRCRSCHRRAGARNGRPNPFDEERAARLYEAGASSTGIAAVLGVGPSTVLRALRARGVAIRPRRLRASSTVDLRDPHLVDPKLATNDAGRIAATPPEPGQRARRATTQRPNGKSTPTHHDPVDPVASPGGPARGGHGGEATPC